MLDKLVNVTSENQEKIGKLIEENNNNNIPITDEYDVNNRRDASHTAIHPNFIQTIEKFIPLYGRLLQDIIVGDIGDFSSINTESDKTQDTTTAKYENYDPNKLVK